MLLSSMWPSGSRVRQSLGVCVFCVCKVFAGIMSIYPCLLACNSTSAVPLNSCYLSDMAAELISCRHNFPTLIMCPPYIAWDLI